MTVAHKLKARNKYRCDICGKEDFWSPGWSRYSSFAHDEACPDDVPTVCNDQCKAELDARIKDGRIELPKVRIEPRGCVVSKPGRGYGK